MEKEENLSEALNRIQRELKAPKGQFNSFGNFKYRSCEDILESVKPLLGRCLLNLDDEIVLVGDRYYVKATATLFLGDKKIFTSAYAREALEKTKMDVAQVTGTSSTYARKYALNGLFLIDDSKDPDEMDNTKEVKKPAKKETNPNVADFEKDLQPTDEEIANWRDKLEMCSDLKAMKAVWTSMPVMVQDELKGIKEELKAKLSD